MVNFLIKYSLKISNYLLYLIGFILFCSKVVINIGSSAQHIINYLTVGVFGFWLGMHLMQEIWKDSLKH